MKLNLVKNIFLRLLIFFIFLILLRFTYIISFNADFCNLSSSSNFCFFSKTPSSSSSSLQQQHSSQINFLPNFRGSLEYEFYSKIFQDFIFHGFLSPDSSSFFLSSSHIIALKDLGINQSFSLSSEINPASLLPFSDQSFDFMFFHKFDPPSSIPLLGFVLEIERTLKPSGILVIHTEIKDFYSFRSILELFDFCNLVKARDIPGPSPSIREIILKKSINSIRKTDRKDKQCSVSRYKIQLIKNLEPLIEKEPLKPWSTLKRNLRNAKYLTSTVDISFKTRYAYIDVGTRSYDSSIGSWFNRRYPKQNKTFEVFAIEADKSFHRDLRAKKDVTLLPYAAWVRNETLFFEINREPTKKTEENRGNRRNRGMGRIQPVQSSIKFEGNVDKIRGFDFAEWLKGEFEERDFVVVKMDVEGTEFHLIPRLIETGALCLIDEIFLECHYKRWQKCCPGIRSPKYDKTYVQCLNLLSSLRKRGVVIHQWW